jgi:predicted RNase H-like HicB family nuclease
MFDMRRYAVVIEKADTGYGASVPDLSGCVAAADTLEQTATMIRDAIEFHLDGMRAHGDPIPAPTTVD